MKRLALLITLAFISGSILAGTVTHTEVSVNSASRTAYGSMVGARNSADNNQYIGCALVNSGSPYAICFSRNASGTTGYCSTTDAIHMDQVTGLNNEAYLYYQWDTGGSCTYIYSQASSYRHN